MRPVVTPKMEGGREKEGWGKTDGGGRRGGAADILENLLSRQNRDVPAAHWPRGNESGHKQVSNHLHPEARDEGGGEGLGTADRTPTPP